MKKIVSVMLSLLTAVCCTMTAFAAELPTVALPVEVTLSGALPKTAEDYTFVLEAEDEACPMPDEAIDGSYSMTITGEGSETFPAITYDSLGVYHYTVYQVAGDNEKCTYDDTVYSVEVDVVNNPEGEGMVASVYVTDGAGEKQEGVTFENVYETEPTPTPNKKKSTTKKTSSKKSPKTGDDANLTLYAVLGCVGAALIVLLVATRKREN